MVKMRIEMLRQKRKKITCLDRGRILAKACIVVSAFGTSGCSRPAPNGASQPIGKSVEIDKGTNSGLPFHAQARGGGDALVTPQIDRFRNYLYVDRARNVGILAHVQAEDEYADLRTAGWSIEVIIGNIGTIVEFCPNTVVIVNSRHEARYHSIAPGVIDEMIKQYERERDSPEVSLRDLVKQYVPQYEALDD